MHTYLCTRYTTYDIDIDTNNIVFYFIKGQAARV
jgi:hypothetical protein